MFNVKRWLRKYRLHLLVWVLYMLYEYVIVALLFGDYGTLLGYLTHYIIIIALFYCHADLILRYALEKRNAAAWRLPLLILLELGLYLAVAFADDTALVRLHMMQLSRPLTFNYHYGLRNLYRGLYFVGFSTGYYFLVTYHKERLIRTELERHRLKEIIWRQQAEQELVKAYNAFLKAQINPHFLFNTLDFIYHHIMELSPVAAEAIIRLADMMRFATDADKMGEYIPLGEEIEQVTNLQFLNQVRKQETVPFHFTHSAAAEELNFIPLVLLTLTENIFKHGYLTAQDAALLNVGVREGLLVIESDNPANRSAPSLEGTGLTNIGKRLQYAYGAAASFNYGQDEKGHFKVRITVPVTLLHGTAEPLRTLINSDKE